MATKARKESLLKRYEMAKKAAEEAIRARSNLLKEVKQVEREDLLQKKSSIKDRWTLALRLRREGETFVSIAKTLGVSPKRAAQIVRRAEIAEKVPSRSTPWCPKESAQ